MTEFTPLYADSHFINEGSITIDIPFTGNTLFVEIDFNTLLDRSNLQLGILYIYAGNVSKGYRIDFKQSIISLPISNITKIRFIPTLDLYALYTLTLKYATVGSVIDSPNAYPLSETITGLPNRVANLESITGYHSRRLDTVEEDLEAIVAPSWENLTDKPSVFPPSTHAHSIDDVSGLTEALAAIESNPSASSWESITDKPSVFPPASHQHVINDVINLSDSLATIGTRLTNLESISSSSNVLTANRTYFVRPDGNDSNNGLSNTPLGAFASPNRFYSELARLSKNGFTVTCQLASGTYTLSSTCVVRDGLGSGEVVITGSTSNRNDCVITGTNIDLLSLQTIKGHTFQNLSFTYAGSTEYLSLITAKDSIFRLINVRFNLAANAIGLNLNENSICNAESLSFAGNGYVNILANEASFNYKDGTAIDFSSSLSFVSLQGEGGKFRFFNVDFNGSGTKSHWLRGYSKVVYRTGKSLSGDATNSLVIIS